MQLFSAAVQVLQSADMLTLAPQHHPPLQRTQNLRDTAQVLWLWQCERGEIQASHQR